MSIRVNTNDVSLTSQTGQAEPVKPAGPGGSGRSGAAKTGDDHIDVSAAAENISSALAAQSLRQSQNVKQLGALVADGSYHVASEDLSRVIVSRAIGGSSGAQ